MTWVDGYEYEQTSAGGSWANDVGDKICLHTTEGGWDSAMSVFRRGSSPHFLVDPMAKRRVQLISLDRAAFALWNEPGGIEPNRAGRVIQFEIVGYAALTPDYPDHWYQYLAECIRLILPHVDIPARITKFYGPGDGYVLATVGWVGRMDGSEFNNYRGIFGHQNVGENDHWDPGKLDAAKLLYFTFGGGEIYDPVTDQTHHFGNPSMDFALQRATTEEQELMAAADDIIRKVAEVQNYLGEAFGGSVEVYPGPDGTWRTAALVNGKCTHGGSAMPQLTALAYEAASATRRPLPGPAPPIDYDRLAEAVVAKLLNKLTAK